MPSMPMLSTPAFSEICSPRPASSKGTPAVTAPAMRAVRKDWVRRMLMSECSLGGSSLPAPIEVLDQGEKQEHQRDQNKDVVLRDPDMACGAFAASHQSGKEQRKG